MSPHPPGEMESWGPTNHHLEMQVRSPETGVHAQTQTHVRARPPKARGWTGQQDASLVFRLQNGGTAGRETCPRSLIREV